MPITTYRGEGSSAFGNACDGCWLSGVAFEAFRCLCGWRDLRERERVGVGCWVYGPFIIVYWESINISFF
jgi:hypothetical protein